MNQAIDIDLLPPILQEIVELIGLHLAMKLVQQYGGVRLYVPKEDVSPGHELVKLLGAAAVKRLQSRFGGDEHFDIPKAERALRAARDVGIKARRHNASCRSLAIEYRLTERRIRSICNDEDNDRQQSLF